MRKSQFTVDAESVQNNAGAEVTFHCVTVKEMRVYRTTEQTDAELLQEHILTWSGIVDDEGNELPNPADDPEVLGKLYVDELTALGLLLLTGLNGEHVKG